MSIFFLTIGLASCLFAENMSWSYPLLVWRSVGEIKVRSPQGGDGIVGASAVGDRPWKAAGFEKSIIHDCECSDFVRKSREWDYN